MVTVAPGVTVCDGEIVILRETVGDCDNDEVWVKETVRVSDDDNEGVRVCDGDELAEPVTLAVDVGLAAQVSLIALRRMPRYAVWPAQL